jgi:hypothetical protein
MLIDAAETAHTIQEAPGFAIHVAGQPQSSRKAILTILAGGVESASRPMRID